MIFLFAIFVVAQSAFAWPWNNGKNNDANQALVQDSLKREELKKLQREVDALNHIRLQKADSLEKLEALHWRKRYEESKLTEDHQVETRELDARYSKLSTDLGRVSEEVMASKGVTNDAEESAKSDEISYDAIHTQIKLSVEKSINDVVGDYPVGMNNRLVNLKNAQLEADKENPNTLSVTSIYLNDLLYRHQLTYSQSLEKTISQLGNRPDVNVNRLRLGTIFLGEIAMDNGEVQALIRSGALQGKVYEWTTSLPTNMSAAIKKAVGDAMGTSRVEIPLDVLQNKAIKNAITDTKELTTKEKIADFFSKGGIVMYPLLLVAIVALLLFGERFLLLTYRGRIGKQFMKSLNTFIEKKKYDEASNLCLKRDTSLSMVLFAVLNKANESRESAEKSLQEALLREQPKLDRRMGLLAAMGSIAPLLGLLGTVTGIITLFTVITEVGTNDARVLAGGISEALITTETGLVIAIPVMVLHGLLSEKIEKVTSELYVQSTSLMNKLFPNEKA